MIVFRLILYFLLFLLIARLVRLIMKYWSSSRGTIDDLKQEQKSVDEKYKDAQEAEFREINFDEQEDIEKEE
ncbi:hypothetical protein LJE86_05230 [bacterium BMS3Abin03]|nr:hypothetical protein [bacterium BMS3Abin03]